MTLAVGAEKMHIDDPERTMALFDTAYDVSDPDALRRTLRELGGEVDGTDLGRRSIFMDIYAAMARNHMRRYGTTPRQIAAVAAKNHAHAVDNPRAHYRKAMSVEEVLAARKLSYPLAVPMCAPVTDGAAAVVVCSDEGLRRLGAERPVQVLATVIGTGTDRDTTTFSLGGTIPVNPSGGLESKGHPLGASGLGQVFELTEQLRDAVGRRQVDDARIALAEKGGGFHRGEEAVTSVIILAGR